jgi:hypothetical protein
MNRLLILACSQRKVAAPGPLPAIERYDGPAFRVLRKYLRAAAPPRPTVLILSAKFGLLRATARIPDYDHRLTSAAAAALRPSVARALKRVLKSRPWDVVGVCAGKNYRVSLQDLDSVLPEGVRLDVIGGGLGPRLTRLRAWLHAPASKAAVC